MRPTAAEASVTGLVLAAGAGTRFGHPKGLARTDAGESWVAIAVRMLRAAGCDRILVAVGAAGDEVAALVPPEAEVVRVADWAEGLSASLRAGLIAASGADASGADAVVVITVDIPDLPAAAVRRVLAAAGPLPHALVQAVYGGRPGHPVVLGRTRIAAVAASVRGDRGAGPYLAEHGAQRVECGDLWSGEDIDSR
ncbi:nucleotidyltransferase family protein [Microbacterium caowuchunii]|uniref:NTP transferase domain-containing protein n=1 Tax=Microbacterium caowuchunii TaxID=2614638 RepID=A0A5N0TIZ9_9MICO|nr:NTP transferase domain-containing protein [Microbacterium caowuchunii]KAA9134581.1 NTP transferase domain-containing protein [Microbacterium caowuchunii]